MVYRIAKGADRRFSNKCGLECQRARVRISIVGFDPQCLTNGKRPVPNTQEVHLPAVVNERLLEVPDYQRPYAWRKKQLEDLWEDLDLLGPRGGHYAGTLMLHDITLAD